MAIELQVLFPDRSTPGTPGYPGGSGKPSDPLTDNGTPFTTPIFNDNLGFSDILLAKAGVPYSGVPDTALLSDRFEALQKLFAAYPAYYEDSRVLNEYTLLAVPPGKTMEEPFRPGTIIHVYKATSTISGALTFKIGSSDPVPVTEPDGSTPARGRLFGGQFYTFIYRNSRFEIITNNRLDSPRMEVEYGTSSGDNDGISYSSNTTTRWPIYLASGVGQNNTISGATFNSGNNSFTLPHGFIYKIDMTGSLDDNEVPSGSESKNRIFIAKFADPNTPILLDINCADPDNQNKTIRGYLNFSTEPAPVECAVYVRSQNTGKLGQAITTPTWSQDNIYFRGTIIQTGYY
jgi:hypothetical protein